MPKLLIWKAFRIWWKNAAQIFLILISEDSSLLWIAMKVWRRCTVTSLLKARLFQRQLLSLEKKGETWHILQVSNQREMEKDVQDSTKVLDQVVALHSSTLLSGFFSGWDNVFALWQVLQSNTKPCVTSSKSKEVSSSSLIVSFRQKSNNFQI